MEQKLISAVETAGKYLSAVNKNSILHSCRTLSGAYFDSSENKRYEKAIFSFDGKYISFNENTVNSLERSEFSAEKKLWLEDLIQYNLLRFQGLITSAKLYAKTVQISS